MKYLTVIKSSLLLALILVISSVSFAGHASALTTTSHVMDNMDHSSYNAGSCAMQCRVAALNKDIENIQEGEEKTDKDKSATPFYSTTSNWNFSQKLTQQKQYADTVKPPPKTPVYIRYAVFRV